MLLFIFPHLKKLTERNFEQKKSKNRRLIIILWCEKDFSRQKKNK